MKLQTCRICLATGVKMSSIGGTQVKNFLENIFKSNGYTQDLDERHYACYECKALLQKTYNFIQKTLRAQKAMYDILQEHDSVNIVALRSIDRCSLGLISTLGYHQVGVDFHIDEEDNILKGTLGEEIDSKEELKKITVEVDSDEILYDESSFMVEVKVKQEEIDEPQSEDVDEFADQITYATEIAVPDVSVQKDKRTIRKEKTKQDETRLPVKKRKRRNKGTPRGRPRVHFEIDGREYPRKCDHCNYMVEQKKIHYKHYLFCHPNVVYPYHVKPKFVCQFCGISKRTERRLRDHELTHGEKQVECPDCKRKFHNHTQLYRHNQRVHVEKQMLICDYCRKGFKVKSELMLHIRTHTGEKPFKCDICGAAFAHRGNVGVHVRNVHQKDAPQRKPNNKTKNLTNYAMECMYAMDCSYADPSITPSTMDTE
ncbi:zinc finger protein 614-like [Hyposmocoma kahamanoa]|uniref:zinc finger protein 614-like n=1 Tax=Hyposmocoma kahamanoa TaxID=1477025 RepID=UPI000E6D8264|nr:zinc finger protein 614-like [Hyposmocoma kahamanoa]